MEGFGRVAVRKPDEFAEFCERPGIAWTLWQLVVLVFLGVLIVALVWSLLGG